MLRICYCLSHYHPVASGAERQAHLQGRELVRRGHRVCVITREVPGQPTLDEREGVRIHRTIRPREWGPGFGVTFVATLARSLRRLRDEYDLVHCHQGLWEAVAAGIALPRLAKPSVVQPAAGGEFGEVHQLSRTRGRSLLKRLILRNTHFVAISEQIEHELAGLGVPPPRLTRLASGVDTDSFSPGPSELEQVLPARPRVLFLGRLHAQKNLTILLAAWPEVRRRVGAALILAGDGPERASLQAQVQSSGCAASVHFVGATREPLAYLRAADLFVLPSVAEGMSNSLLEAMAVGLPVVVSRIGGNADLVVPGETGLVVDPADVPGWGRAIADLLDDAARARQLGCAARELATTRYSIRVIVDRYIHLYESLLAAARPAGCE